MALPASSLSVTALNAGSTFSLNFSAISLGAGLTVAPAAGTECFRTACAIATGLANVIAERIKGATRPNSLFMVELSKDNQKKTYQIAPPQFNEVRQMVPQ